MARKERMVRIYEVLVDTDSEGPTGDGTVVYRFRHHDVADSFAYNRTCWGRPATVAESYVPLRLAKRYGCA